MQPVDKTRRPKSAGNSDSRLVDREEFMQLLVSRKPLIREDDARSFMFVLRDYTSGTRYLLPERLMQRYL